MFRTVVIALLVLSPVTVAAHSDRTTRIWSVEDGLPTNSITSLLSARDGYLWIGSWAGIVRFDGVRFTPLGADLPNVHALVLGQAKDGAIWIAAVGVGVIRYVPGSTQTFTPAEGLVSRTITSMVVDGDALWAGANGGLSRLSKGRIRTWRGGDGLVDSRVASLTLARGGGVWAVTPSGLCRVREDSIRCDEHRLRGASPTAILEDRSGQLWVGASAGLFSTGTKAATKEPCRPSPCFPGRRISSLFESRDGALWIGFSDSPAVARLKDGVTTQYKLRDGSPDGVPQSFVEDAEGSLWVATDRDGGGLVQLRPKRVSVYTTADGISQKVVGSILQDDKGAIWAASECGPVTQLREGRFSPRLPRGIVGCVMPMIETRDRVMFLGTKETGAYRIEGTTVRHLGVREGLSDLNVTVLFEDRDGVVWIGTAGGGVHRFENGRLSRAFGPADGLATGQFSAIVQDRAGRIWLASNANGLTVYEGGAFHRPDDLDGLPTGNVSALLVDSVGDLWVGTAQHGLFRRRDRRYQAFGLSQGLGDSLVALLLEDAESNLWVSTVRGIVRLERAKIEAVASGAASSLEAIILDRSDGLLNPEGVGGGFDPSGLVARDGRLWFSTINGIVVVDPKSMPINRRPAPVVIEQIKLDGRTAARSAEGNLEIAPGNSSVEVEYTALSFIAPERVRFRYRLAGVDEQWQNVGARRVAYYSQLRPGSYRFEVQAANNDGVWGTQSASLGLLVAPFWYERSDIRFVTLAVLLSATLLVGRAVALRRARAQLVELERERTLHRERERIARDLHDDLGARLTHIALMADHLKDRDGAERLSAQAREAASTVDELVWSVNARNDSAEGFAQYASRYAEEATAASGLSLRLRIQPDLGARPLGADARRHLYLAYKEAMNNLVKHAQATEVQLALKVEGGALILEIADDGRGLPESAGEGSGHGLRNMAERMGAVGGRFDLSSRPGQGTRLTFVVPLGAAS